LIVQTAGIDLQEKIKLDLESAIATQIALAIQTIKTNVAEDKLEEREKFKDEIKKEIKESNKNWDRWQRILIAIATISGILGAIL